MKIKLRLLIAGVLGALYIALTCQHPQFNFDDLLLVTEFERLISKQGLWNAIVYYFRADDLPTEYRTYSLARVAQVVLYPIFGKNPLPYYLVMASVWLTIAVLVGDLIRTAQRSSVWTIEAFGASIIVAISPFAMCRTFHHFAYLILPMLLILGMLWIAQRTQRPLLSSLPFAVLVPFLGEAAIPVLFVSIVTIAWQRRRPVILMLIPLSLALIAVHYWFLSQTANFGGANRYVAGDASLIERNIAFFSSVGSTILRGLWLPHIDREPYQNGLRVTVDMWSHLDWRFVVVLIIFGALVIVLTRPAPSAAIPRRSLAAVVAMCAAAFSIYVLLAQVTIVHGVPYGLQAHYGWVPLTASTVAMFLLLRQTPFRTVALAVPGVLLFVWVAVVTVQTPRQATIDRRLFAEIASVADKNPPVILVGHRSPVRWGHTPGGAQNPFVLSIDTPFQQYWTTEEAAKFVAPDTKVWSHGFKVESDMVRLMGSPDNATVVPIAGSYVIGTTTIDLSDPHVLSLDDWLAAPNPRTERAIAETPKEIRGAQFGSLAQLEGYYYIEGGDGATLHLIWKALGTIDSNTSFAVHMLAKPGGEILAQGDYAGRLVPIKANEQFEDVVDLSKAQLTHACYVGIGLYPSRTGNLFRVSHGPTDWDGRRLLISVPQSLNENCTHTSGK